MPQSHFSFISSILWETMSNAFESLQKPQPPPSLSWGLLIMFLSDASAVVPFNFWHSMPIVYLKLDCSLWKPVAQCYHWLQSPWSCLVHYAKKPDSGFQNQLHQLFLISRCKPSCFPTGENHFIFNATVINSNREDRICYPDLKRNSRN